MKHLQTSIFLCIIQVYSAGSLKICPSAHINKDVEQLEQISLCDVINGNLIINSIEATKQKWDGAMLKVQEITGFLLLYNLTNIESLHTLLANLHVVKGRELLHGKYAIAISKIHHMEALDLYNLTTILHGGVFTSDNPQNYANTVKWDLITNENATNYIEDILPPHTCNQNCSNGSCWSERFCQKTCPDTCKDSGCSPTGECCHPLCLGGCSEPKRFDKCNSCKDFRNGDQCWDACRDYYYEWDGYECVWEYECKKRGRYLYREKNQCVEECPRTFSKDENHICVPKEGNITCPGVFIGSVEDSKALLGCTNINGSLRIRLTSSNNTTELKKNLELIETVTGFVYVFESQLENLNFLSNLTHVGGDTLLQYKYSFVVHDCHHLHSTWNFKTRLTLTKGLAFFYRNPMLCPSQITNLISPSHLSPLMFTSDARDLMNGYKTSCECHGIVVTSKALFLKGVVELQLEKPEEVVRRRLSGYMIYYTEAAHTNFTGREDIDNSWKLQFIEYKNEGGDTFHMYVHGLKPSTRYAFFVTISTMPFISKYQSKEIIYETTKPFNPGMPRNLLQEYTPYSVVLTWSPPEDTYGKIDYYILRLTLTNTTNMSSNLCNSKVIGENRSGSPSEVDSLSSQNFKTSPLESLTRPEIEDVLELFGNFFLHSNRTPSSKWKRSLSREFEDDDSPPPMFGFPPTWQNVMPRFELHELFKEVELEHANNIDPYENPEVILKMIHEELAYKSFLGEPLNFPKPKIHTRSNVSLEFNTTDTSYTIRRFPQNAYNFQQDLYTFEVIACHLVSEDCPNFKNSSCSLCSQQSLKDNICILGENQDVRVRDIVITAVNSTSAQISWNLPDLKPNIVQSFTLYIDALSQHHLKQKLCVNATTTSITTNLIVTGNYKLYISTNLWCRNISHLLTKTDTVHFLIQGDKLGPTILVQIVLSSVCILLVVVLCFIMILWIPRKLNRSNLLLGKHTCTNINYDYWEYTLKHTIPGAWQHDPKNFRITNQLGEGHFGQVFRGLLDTKDGQISVAAKVLKGYRMDKDLIHEAHLMLKARSYHLVRTYGLVLKDAQLYLIMELMRNGSLEEFLCARRCGNYANTPQGSDEQLLHFALQIADGMFYLQYKKIIHRDLAARNCLLDESFNIKISDFGLSRFTQEGGYKTRRPRAVPVRRMPPEYFRNESFTSKCDVWLYGILIWEIATECCGIMYEGFKDQHVNEAILGGCTLNKSFPDDTPIYFKTIASSCWNQDPMQRPCFHEIISRLLFYVRNDASLHNFRNCSFFFEVEKLKLPDVLVGTHCKGCILNDLEVSIDEVCIEK